MSWLIPMLLLGLGVVFAGFLLWDQYQRKHAHR